MWISQLGKLLRKTSLFVVAATTAMAAKGGDKDLEIQKDGSTFVCPWEDFQRPGPLALGKWKFMTPNNSRIPDQDALDLYLPVLEVNSEQLNNAPEDKMQVTWIGHATVLVQFDGISILADPVFRDFAGPELATTIRKLAYWRYRKAACEIKDILKLDAVIISHNHFDHLDEGSVKEIVSRFPHITWFVGMGLKKWFEKRGCKHVIEMLWWDGHDFIKEEKKFRFECVPAQHWSQRELLDKNKTLWCGWVVKGPTKSYYFAGDTGYHAPLFKTIGERFGPIDLAAIPIGAYEPRFIMEYQHADPVDAVNIHQDVNSLCSIGIHWGTFKTMACEFYLEPPRKVEAEMKKRGLKPETFVSLNHGETWILGNTRARPAFMDMSSETVCSK